MYAQRVHMYEVPEVLHSSDVTALLNVGRAMLSRLRDRPGFPPPIPHLSTPRKPVWAGEDIVRWMIATGRAPETALPCLEVADLSAAVRQRWARRDHGRFVEFTDSAGVRATVHATHYDAVDDAEDSRVVTLCVPAGDRGSSPLSGWNLPEEVISALGYGPGGLRGALIWIQPSEDNHPTVLAEDLPRGALASPSHRRLRDGRIVAGLLGHPLPYWPRGGVDKVAVQTWHPQPFGVDTPPVPTHTPPILVPARRFREQCREVIDQITRGEREVPPNMVDELAQLGNTRWDHEARYCFPTGYFHRQPPAGWVRPLVAPVLSTEEATPLLPVQPPAVDLFTALEWLLKQPDLPRGMAESATGYFGYDQSIDVLTLDLATLPGELRDLIDANLRTRTAQPNWLHEALRRELPADSDVTAWEWTSDPDPDSHPVMTAGNLLTFHIPRATFVPLEVPGAVHLVATGEPGHRRIGAFLSTRAGTLFPLPFDPDSSTPANTARVLTGLGWGLEQPLHYGRVPKLFDAPSRLGHIVEALATTNHLSLEWTTLLELLGPRPTDDDNDLIALFNGEDHPWPGDADLVTDRP